jgi:hypothetical protein
LFLFPLMLGLAHAPAPPSSGMIGTMPTSSYCPAETESGRRITLRYASSADYAAARMRDHLPTVDASAVRPLTDRADAETCRRLLRTLGKNLSEQGGSLARVRPVFYEAGGYYYAVLSQRPHHLPRRGGPLYIDARWTPLYVLNRDFEVVSSAAM